MFNLIYAGMDMHSKTNSKISDKTKNWLLSGDVSIQYQVHRDLLDTEIPELKKLQTSIESEGWGARFMSFRRPDGHWGQGLYRPKWTSTHYTLLDLKNLGFPPGNSSINESIELVLSAPEGINGGINFSSAIKESDICVNGMILNYGTWFADNHHRLAPIVDYLLENQMSDGGWNCEHFRGAKHSSLHSTISVLEGLLEWTVQSDSDHLNTIANCMKEAEEFILRHHLFRSMKTGEPIDPKMIRLSYPCRWRYDILRALDYFQKTGISYDARMKDAIDILLKKRLTNGRWPLQQKYKGTVHFDMEHVGEASRWNTLRALRVLHHFNINMPYKLKESTQI